MGVILTTYQSWEPILQVGRNFQFLGTHWNTGGPSLMTPRFTASKQVATWHPKWHFQGFLGQPQKHIVFFLEPTPLTSERFHIFHGEERCSLRSHKVGPKKPVIFRGVTSPIFSWPKRHALAWIVEKTPTEKRGRIFSPPFIMGWNGDR